MNIYITLRQIKSTNINGQLYQTGVQLLIDTLHSFNFSTIYIQEEGKGEGGQFRSIISRIPLQRRADVIECTWRTRCACASRESIPLLPQRIRAYPRNSFEYLDGPLVRQVKLSQFKPLLSTDKLSYIFSFEHGHCVQVNSKILILNYSQIWKLCFYFFFLFKRKDKKKCSRITFTKDTRGRLIENIGSRVGQLVRLGLTSHSS